MRVQMQLDAAALVSIPAMRTEIHVAGRAGSADANGASQPCPTRLAAACLFLRGRPRIGGETGRLRHATRTAALAKIGQQLRCTCCACMFGDNRTGDAGVPGMVVGTELHATNLPPMRTIHRPVGAAERARAE
jgi:hypothetical protein